MFVENIAIEIGSFVPVLQILRRVERFDLGSKRSELRVKSTELQVCFFDAAAQGVALSIESFYLRFIRISSNPKPPSLIAQLVLSSIDFISLTNQVVQCGTKSGFSVC